MFSVTPCNKMKSITMMLKAIHAQESKEAGRRDRGNAYIHELPFLALKPGQNQQYH